jgi:nucleotide-binding universal stress UspA family protein
MSSTLFRRILVPHDFSKPADRALKEAVALARAHGGRLIVHHAITPFYLPGDPRFGKSIDGIPNAASFIPELSGRLERNVAKAVAKTRVRYRVHVTVGDPAAQLLEAARHADCVVMSTHGRSGLAHFILGSVAEKLVRHSPVPVLTLRVQPTAARSSEKRGDKRRAA